MGVLNKFFVTVAAVLSLFASSVLAGGARIPCASGTTQSGSFLQGTSVGNLSTSFPEPSGMGRAHVPANKGYMWIEQDSGGPNSVTAVKLSDATTAGNWTLQGVTQSDFEDLATARINGVNYIYVADIGDNASARGTIVIYRCIEPTITGSDGTISSGNIETITCQYPGGNTPALKDAECFLVDPLVGTMYIITKIFPAQIYSLAHASSYSGTQTLTYVGKLAGDSSTTSLAIGTGSKTFTQASSLAYPIGLKVRAASAANSANFMEGDVTAQSGNSLTINMTTTGGSGTLSDWQLGMGNALTPTSNNGNVQGGTISPDGRSIVLCNYGYPYPGATGQGGTGLFLFTRTVATETVGTALLRAPSKLITADTGGGINYPHSNPPSFPQREAVEFDLDGNLFSVGEYYSTYGTTTNPFVKYTQIARTPTTAVFRNGLNSYSGTTDCYIYNINNATDNSATTSLVADTDRDTFSAIANAGGGNIDITTSSTNVTNATVGKDIQIKNCTVPGYNGYYSLVSKPTSTTLRVAATFTSTATGDVYVTERVGLVKFDISSIPSTATIVGAKLVLYINTEGSAAQINKMKVTWSGTSTWDSLTHGVSLDDTEAYSSYDAICIRNAMDTYTGFYTFNVPVATIQGWLNGTITNYGWVVGGDETLGDGFQFDSSEGATQARKPMLIVRYTTP